MGCGSSEIRFSLSKWRGAANKTCTSRYAAACAIYFVYSVAMVIISSPTIAEEDKDKLYFQFAVIHAINAFMFIWSWEDRSYFDKVMIPEYLNVLGAGLYLWSRYYFNLDFSMKFSKMY